MRRPLTQLVLTIAFMLAGLTHAFAEKRVALVIGNSAYEHTPVLKNPINDARAIAQTLKSLDFQVIEGRDLDIDQMRETIKTFRGALEGANVALLYFAGHGIQVAGKNYLMPVSAKLEDELDLRFGTISLDHILKIMSDDDRVSLAFLDACRNNPMAAALSRSLASKTKVRGVAAPEVGKGLAAVEAAAGMMVSYSTSPGEVALDGSGANGPYAQAVVKHLATPGQSVLDMMTKVRRDVLASSKGRQRTWEHSSLTGRFFFQKTGPVAATAAEVKVAAAETAGTDTKSDEAANEAAGKSGDIKAEVKLQLDAYREADKIGTCNAYRAFAETYPDSYYATLARERAASTCAADAKKTASADDKQAKTTAPVEKGKAKATIKTRQVVIEPAEKTEPKKVVIVEPKQTVTAAAPEKAEAKKLAAAEAKPEATTVTPEKSDTEKTPVVKKRQIVIEPTEPKAETADEKKVAAKAEKAAEKIEIVTKKASADPVVTGATPAKAPAKAEEVAAKTEAPAEPVKVAKAEIKKEPAEKTEEAKPAEVIDPKAIVLALQEELERVGCSPGKPDGIWGHRSRAALEAFAHHADKKLKSSEPTTETLDLVKGKTKRVCPVACGAGEINHDGKCVAYDCPPGTQYSADGGCVPHTYSKRRRPPGYGGYRRPYNRPGDYYGGRGRGGGSGGYGGGGGYRY